MGQRYCKGTRFGFAPLGARSACLLLRLGVRAARLLACPGSGLPGLGFGFGVLRYLPRADRSLPRWTRAAPRRALPRRAAAAAGAAGRAGTAPTPPAPAAIPPAPGCLRPLYRPPNPPPPPPPVPRLCVLCGCGGTDGTVEDPTGEPMNTGGLSAAVALGGARSTSRSSVPSACRSMSSASSASLGTQPLMAASRSPARSAPLLCENAPGSRALTWLGVGVRVVSRGGVGVGLAKPSQGAHHHSACVTVAGAHRELLQPYAQARAALRLVELDRHRSQPDRAASEARCTEELVSSTGASPPPPPPPPPLPRRCGNPQASRRCRRTEGHHAPGGRPGAWPPGWRAATRYSGSRRRANSTRT